VAILAKPDDHRGILTMREAIDTFIEAFRNWAKDPLVAALRRRGHRRTDLRQAFTAAQAIGARLQTA
jgi:hypothetical protein